MLSGEVNSYQDYYVKAQQISVSLSSRVAKWIRPLKNIEESERNKKLDLPPIPPMMDTLIDYIDSRDL